VHLGTEIEELYRRHGAALVLFAAAISGDRGRAQDAVHQVFLKLLESEAVDRAIDPKAYLFHCVRNTVFNDLKRWQRQVEFDPDSAWFEPPERDHVAERTLRRALSELARGQREVVVLHVWGELTFAQVAEVLGISSNTAASRYRYALSKLRDVMCVREDYRADVGR
jgi:RNA polymerase sigma-70 factor (ECF subfamily)